MKTLKHQHEKNDMHCPQSHGKIQLLAYDKKYPGRAPQGNNTLDREGLIHATVKYMDCPVALIASESMFI